MSSIKSLLVPSKEVDVEYPGMPGFVVSLAFLSRETLQNIRKKATKTTYKNRQTMDSMDDELFLKLYAEATIRNWKGLTFGYLEQLAPVDIGDKDRDEVIPYSVEDALDLLKASTQFDSFISEQVTDLGNFSKNK